MYETASTKCILPKYKISDHCDAMVVISASYSGGTWFDYVCAQNFDGEFILLLFYLNNTAVRCYQHSFFWVFKC
jgi:hypothetical protein